MSKLVERAYETSRGWLALGHERIPSPHALIVRDREHSDVYDANFAALVRAATEPEIRALLAQMDEVFSASDHRFVFWDAAMPQPFEARLVVDGWKLWNEMVTLVLEGELRADPPQIEIRPAASAADWLVIEDMHWLDAQEEVKKGLQPAYGREITEAMVRTKRRKAPAVQYFLARVDGVDCAFFSAWPGDNGVGQIEDLYTLPAFRGRGIARALMVKCVEDARARGAGPIIICARAEDTPKRMYEAMGFRPLCVQRGYLKHASAGGER
ncbi:MAG TPA: GNAT family N-acetyltransferase [Polyangiales bacterium]|nr:GNAT family N-acetyltransferase [Polyangiales bacterium]